MLLHRLKKNHRGWSHSFLLCVLWSWFVVVDLVAVVTLGFGPLAQGWLQLLKWSQKYLPVLGSTDQLFLQKLEETA
jgi:hypothetical protein